MPSTHTVSRSANYRLALAQLVPQSQPHGPSQAARFCSLRLAWAVVAIGSLVSACGGGGGDAPTPPAPPVATPLPARPPVVLSAEEDVAWKSYVLRAVGVRAVTDEDDAIIPGTPFLSVGRFDFAGLYPAGTGAGTTGQSNVPPIDAIVGFCKDGGNSSVAFDDKNKNGISEAGDSVTRTDTDCKDKNATLNGTTRFDNQATPTFYAKPHENAIITTKGLAAENLLFAKAETNFTLTQSIKGQIDVDVSEFTRVYRYKNYTYVIDGVTIINNLVLTINRSVEFGPNKPFSLTSMTGSLTIDGVNYQVSSSPNIPWKKTPGYLPIAVGIAMTGPGGEQIITEFTATGAGCRLIPLGTTTPSIVVRNCSRI
jgi:hypothetical protein